jgi:hypothetical protein
MTVVAIAGAASSDTATSAADTVFSMIISCLGDRWPEWPWRRSSRQG